MGLLDFFRSRKQEPDHQRGWFTNGTSLHEALRLRTGAGGDPFSTHAVVYRCVSVIARSLSSIPFALYTGDLDDRKLIPDGPWYRLFLRPNLHMSGEQLWEATATYLQLGGACYWILQGAGEEISEDEVPLQLWPVPQSCVTPELDPQQRELIGYRINVGAETLQLPPHAVVAIRYFNPNDPWRGLSPLSAAMAGFRQDAKASSLNESYFDNGADPGGILSSSQSITKDQRKELRQAWEDRHRGADKSHRVAVLGSGLDYKQLSISHRDMQFLEQRRWNREEIAMCFGVPKFFLGVTDDLNYATSKSAERILWSNTLLPTARMIGVQLEAQLFSRRTAVAHDVEWGEFDTSQVEALREDLETKLAAAEAFRRLGYPLNEINTRLDLGMEEQEGGDVGLLPLGLAPADEVADGMDFDDDLGSVFGPIGDEPVDPVRARASDTRLRAWKRIVRSAMDPLERKFRRRLNGYLQGRRVELLRFLGDRERSRALNDKLEQFLVAAESRWNDLLEKALGSTYREGVVLGAESLLPEIGKFEFFDTQNPEVLRFLADKQIRVKRVNDTIIKTLRQQLLEGISKTETTTELQDRVRKAFNTTRSRARTIARTEAAQTVNGARQLVMEAEGIERIEWISSGDQYVRPEHQALDGQIRTLGQSFSDAVTLRHPGDLRCSDPSQVINCRCSVGPVLD